MTGFSTGAAGLVRIPTTSQLLTSNDFFYDCVPIAVGSVVNAPFHKHKLTLQAVCWSQGSDLLLYQHRHSTMSFHHSSRNRPSHLSQLLAHRSYTRKDSVEILLQVQVEALRQTLPALKFPKILCKEKSAMTRRNKKPE